MLAKRVKGVSEEEVDSIVQMAESIIEYNKRAKDTLGLDQKYQKAIRYYMGEHAIREAAKSPILRKKVDALVYNKFGQIVDDRISHIADSELRWTFEPVAEDDLGKADAFKTLIGDVMFEYSHWEEKQEESIMDCAFAGSTHIKCIPDPNTGYVNFIPVKEPAAFPDGGVNNERDIRNFVHLIPKSISDIEEDYGVTGIQPEPMLEDRKDGMTLGDAQLTYQASSSTDYTMENVYDRPGGLKSGGVDLLNDVQGRAVIAELWLEDKKMERIPFDKQEVEEEHDDFSKNIPHKVMPDENHVEHIKYHLDLLEKIDPQVDRILYQHLKNHIEVHKIYPQTEKRRKYPRGRVITICQGKLLRDEPNPYPIGWRDIFIKWDWKKNPGSYWGKSLTQDLFDPQDALNHRKNSITKNINMLNTGVVYMKRGIFEGIFGKSKKAFNNVDGKVIPVNQRGDVERNFGPPIPAHVIEDREHTESFMDNVSNRSDLTSGRYPSGSPPAVTVDQLLGEAKTPIRNVLKHYAIAFKKMAKNIIVCVDSYMPPEEQIRVLGREHSAIQMIQWGELTDLAKDVKVGAELNLPSARKEKLREAIELRREGVFDNTAVLMRLNDPDKYQIVQRMSEIAQLQMALQGTVDQLERKDKEINTMMNRMQTNEGKGNVGSQKTSK